MDLAAFIGDGRLLPHWAEHSPRLRQTKSGGEEGWWGAEEEEEEEGEGAVFTKTNRQMMMDPCC